MTDEFQEVTFYEIDNLDTKTVADAEDNFEKAFIVIRDSLEDCEPFCCNDWSDRLKITQVVADSLRTAALIRKETK